MARRPDIALDSIVDAVRDWNKKGLYRHAPSFRDLAEITGLPLGTTHRFCRLLREEGLIDFEDHIARSIHLVERKPASST